MKSCTLVDSTVVKYKDTSVLRERIHLWRLKIIQLHIRQAINQNLLINTHSSYNAVVIFMYKVGINWCSMAPRCSSKMSEDGTIILARLIHSYHLFCHQMIPHISLNSSHATSSFSDVALCDIFKDKLASWVIWCREVVDIAVSWCRAIQCWILSRNISGAWPSTLNRSFLCSALRAEGHPWRGAWGGLTLP